MNPSDYDAVYHYAPAPLMPGIRKLHGNPEEKYIVDYEFDAERENFIPSRIPYYNNPRPDMFYLGLPIFESFSDMTSGYTGLIVFILIICAIVYYVKKNNNVLVAQ